MGDSTATDRWTAGAVPNLTNIVGIAAGRDFSVAVDKDGVVRGWGDNGVGQLGTSTPSYRTAAATITGLSGATFVAAGTSHVIALDANHAVMTFGENTAGALGDGTTTNRATPEPNYDFSGRVATPTFSVASGSYGSDFTVVVSNATGGSTMHYTQNGSEPTTSDPTIASGSSIAIAQSQALKVTAWKTGTPSSDVGSAVYEMKVATPSLSPGAGMFSSPTSVTLSTATAGAVVRYTLDGSDPTPASAQYTSPVLVDHTSTLKVDGFKSNWSDSNVNTGIYTMNFGMVAAPTVEPAAGTYTSAGTVTMSSTHEGAIIRFTTNGETPTASSAAYTSPLSLDGSMTVKAKAFHPDYAMSAETSRAYTLAAAAPTIDPTTGVFTGAQTVTMTAAAEPSVTVRYTLDGSEPTETSTAYTAAFSVDTATTIKARSFPSNGWAVSEAASAALSFSYGTLDPPTASPAGGVFAEAQMVTWTAAPGAVVRYTTNGTEPTLASPAYASPIAVSSGTIKARAYHPDWTESATSTEIYAIDVTPPTIVAKRFPLPMGNWHLTPVTVNFVCSDSVGIATCTSPLTVSLEGSGQTVSGTAVDQVGLESTAQETVNVDLTPPVVTLTTPVDGQVTASSSVVVSAEVNDALSGLGVVKCNGVDTPVVDGVVSCTATLRPGRNSITVSARDVAGHSRSAGATITLAGTPSNLTLSPAARTLLVGETATLSLRDNFGVPAPAATWNSSEPSVVSLSEDDPPVLTALASGTATVQAFKNGLSAVATLTVVAGESLPDGTTRWNVAPTPGGGFSWLEGPIYTNRMVGNDPDLFMVETNTTTWERRLRAISSASGEVAWLASAPGVPLMGDMFGGVIAGIEPSNNYCVGPFNEIQRCYIGLARVAASAGTTAWRYDSPGMVDRPAQGPDGTIYVVEHIGDHLYVPNDNGNGYFAYPGEKALVILDGATGEVTARVPLEGDDNYEPVTVGPIVGSDGFGYVLTTKGMQLTLHQFSRDGQVASAVIVPATCSGSQCRQPVPRQLLPNGLGGLLITADWGNAAYLTTDLRLTQFDGNGGRTDTVIPYNTGRIDLIGRGGFAYLRETSGASTVGQPVMDISTWTTRWHLPIEWSLLAATAGGGAEAQNAAGDIGYFDGTGQLLRTIPAVGLRNPVQDSGGLIGASGIEPNTPSGLRKIEGSFEDATYFSVTYAPRLWTGTEQYGFGNQPRNLAPPEPRFPWLPQRAPDIGPHEALYDSLDDLIYRLKNDPNLAGKAQTHVFNKLGSGWTVANFVKYLEDRPHFYDGYKSTLCYAALTGELGSSLCGLFGQSVRGRMQSDGKIVALAWLGLKPLHVFFDPMRIALSGEGGKNIGNEALIFHEALHGFTNHDDDALKALLGLGGPTSCVIEEHIKVEVLYFAPGLNLSTGYDCH